MPRQPRLDIPNVPLHITQRGVNRCATFIDDVDRQNYLHFLLLASQRYEVRIHAYVLMSNHLHLLASSSLAGAVSRMMRWMGQRYVAFFNKRYERTGTLWEGRFRSFLVDSERYILMVYRYIELNPVRAALVERAQEYAWSSAKANLGLKVDPLVVPHSVFLALGYSSRERGEAYEEWLSAGTGEDELLRIRLYIQQQRAMGSPGFQAMVERALGRPGAIQPQGRPIR